MPITDPLFDALLRQHFHARNITLEENTAYRFIDGYPCTDIAKHIPSSLLEITKGSLSTPEWQDAIDTSLIVFDPDRVALFADLLSAVIGDYLSTQE